MSILRLARFRLTGWISRMHRQETAVIQETIATTSNQAATIVTASRAGGTKLRRTVLLSSRCVSLQMRRADRVRAFPRNESTIRSCGIALHPIRTALFFQNVRESHFPYGSTSAAESLTYGARLTVIKCLGGRRSFLKTLFVPAESPQAPYGYEYQL